MAIYRLSLFQDGEPEPDIIGDRIDATFLPQPGMILFHGDYRCEVVRIETSTDLITDGVDGRPTWVDVIVKAQIT